MNLKQMDLQEFTKNFEASKTAAPSGAGDALLFEPLLLEFIIHFNKLRTSYPDKDDTV